MAWVVAAVMSLVIGLLGYALTLELPREGRWVLTRVSAIRRWRARRSPPTAQCRPIEEVAGEIRRLGPRFRYAPRGRSFAKSEGIRRAYDGVLLEGCRALGLDTTLGDLPAGEERDLERLRVEHQLGLAGLRYDDAA